jgi:hypothetical protein
MYREASYWRLASLKRAIEVQKVLRRPMRVRNAQVITLMQLKLQRKTENQSQLTEVKSVHV